MDSHLRTKQLVSLLHRFPSANSPPWNTLSAGQVLGILCMYCPTSDLKISTHHSPLWTIKTFCIFLCYETYYIILSSINRAVSTSRAGVISNSSSYLQCSSKCLTYCKHLINDELVGGWMNGEEKLYRLSQLSTPPLLSFMKSQHNSLKRSIS